MLKTKPFPPPVEELLVGTFYDVIVPARTETTKGSAAEPSTAHTTSEELSEQLLRAYLLVEHTTSTTARGAAL
jgi:hypothetical protein